MSISGGVSFSSLKATSAIDSDTAAWIGNGADVDATSVDMDATATHNAAVTIDSTGFSFILSVDVIDAYAVDSGTVSARVGPAAPAAGSAGNRTEVDTTGTGGVMVDAKLTSDVTAEPRFRNFSLLGGGGVATAKAEQLGAARVEIGGYADINGGPGNVHAAAEFLGTTRATASTVSGAIGVTVVKSNATANHSPTSRPSSAPTPTSLPRSSPASSRCSPGTTTARPPRSRTGVRSPRRRTPTSR